MTMNSRNKIRLGVLVPFTNTNLEQDMAWLTPSGVSLHIARLGGYDADEIPDASQMSGLGAADLDEPLRLVQGVRPHAILYGCTSATLTHGPKFDKALAARIKNTSGAISVTAAGALVHALQRLRVSRIAFASPYVGPINDQAVAFLGACGITTTSRADIGRVLDNYGQGALTLEEIEALGTAADSPEAEALVLSCTDMRGAEVVERLEARLGKPVVCSNQAMVFQVAEALDLPLSARCGRLFGLTHAAT